MIEIKKWLSFLTNTDDTRWSESRQNKIRYELSVEKLRIAKLDPKIRMEYEDREKALKDIDPFAMMLWMKEGKRKREKWLLGCFKRKWI
ncbi:hypothetical protein KHA80_13125 [Anaerobacillus sp. HL2]|nr:hypothetical protein KHA80_13125 [Anaerobacillus sp. HL2]